MGSERRHRTARERRDSNMARKLALILPVLLSLACAASGCVLVKDSPAPGCREYWGLAPVGGCFGKSVITDLKVEPEVDCLSIEVNNCNGGILEISNDCDESFILGGVVIEPSEHCVGLDVVAQQDGTHGLTRTDSNFSDYVPEEDEQIELVGILGEQEVRVSYVKSGRLC